MQLIKILSIFIFFMLFHSVAFAKNVTFTKEYIYRASDIDSKLSSRAIALEQAKKLLLEELGIYVISETEVSNSRLTRDHIQSFSAGLVKSSIIDEKWDGKTYYIKASITADPESVVSDINKLLDNKALRAELEKQINKTDAALKTIERMKTELATTQATPQLQERYNQEVRKLTAQEWFNTGYLLHTSHDYQGTVDALSESIKLNRNNPEAYLGRASAYWKMRSYQQAILDYNSAIDLDQNLWLAYLGRGAVYSDLGNYEQAIADFTAAIRLNPKSAATYFHRGIAYVSFGNIHLAILDFGLAIELSPLNAEAYNKRGIAHASLANYKKAIEDYDKAIELNPTYAEAYNNRGFAYLEQNQLKKAKNNIDKALDLSPNDPMAHSSMSEYYALINNSAEACTWLSKAIELGYNDWNYIKTSKTLNNIRTAPCYKKLITKE